MMKFVKKIEYCLMVCLGLYIIVSCDSERKRETLKSEIKALYLQNYAGFQFIQKYFTESKDSIISIEIESRQNALNLRKRPLVDTIINWPKTFNNISEAIKENYIAPESQLPIIIELMDKIGLRSISGDTNWIYLTFKEFKVPCYSFWYKTSFDSTNLEIKSKIMNFKNIKSQIWIYPIDEKWYIQGEKCF